MALVILDRDGVINFDSEEYIKTPDEWTAIPGSLEAIARLNYAGFRVVVVTNQAGIGRRFFDIEALNAIHAKMQRQLAEVGGAVEAVFFCPHAPRDHCDCRKPKPGLLHSAAKRLKCNLQDIPFIGDSMRDLDCAVAAGAKPVLVRTGNGKAAEKKVDPALNIRVFDDLAAAAEHLSATAAVS